MYKLQCAGRSDAGALCTVLELTEVEFIAPKSLLSTLCITALECVTQSPILIIPSLGPGRAHFFIVPTPRPGSASGVGRRSFFLLRRVIAIIGLALHLASAATARSQKKSRDLKTDEWHRVSYQNAGEGELLLLFLFCTNLSLTICTRITFSFNYV